MRNVCNKIVVHYIYFSAMHRLCWY